MRLEVVRTQIKRTWFTNLRSLGHSSKQWGAIQRSFTMITPKAVSQTGLNEKKAGDRKEYWSAWFKESFHFYDVSMIYFLK